MPPFWLLPALASHALLALVQISDRFLLSRAVKTPLVYAFFVGATGLITLVAAPPCLILGCLIFPGFMGFFKNIAAGAIFFLALIPFYGALQSGEASRVVPAVGGLVSIFVLVLATLFLGERLLSIHYLALIFLLFGYLAITKADSDIGRTIGVFVNLQVMVTSFLFAVSTILLKDIYTSQPFISAFLWVGYGTSLTALTTLLWPKFRKEIISAPKVIPGGNKLIFITNRIAGGLSVLFFNYALKLGPAALVQATQGAQYIFVLIMASAISLWQPKILREELSASIFFQKGAAIASFAIGLTLIALAGK